MKKSKLKAKIRELSEEIRVLKYQNKEQGKHIVELIKQISNYNISKYNSTDDSLKQCE